MCRGKWKFRGRPLLLWPTGCETAKNCNWFPGRLSRQAPRFAEFFQDTNPTQSAVGVSWDLSNDLRRVAQDRARGGTSRGPANQLNECARPMRTPLFSSDQMAWARSKHHLR